MIVISRHAPGEGPGYLADFLEARGQPFCVVKTDLGEPLPTDIRNIDALVFMGGPMSVNDSLPWIPAALHLIQEATRHKLPVLGHCLGGQLISKALGGVVTPNPGREIGWFPVDVVAGAALADDWLPGLGPQFEVFHWHGETFTVPPGAQVLLSSAGCPRQGFAYGKSLALQCHIEMTAAMVRRWINLGANELQAGGAFVQRAEELLEHLETRIGQLHEVADRIYGRWLQGLR